MKNTDDGERIRTLLTTRLRILFFGLVAACSCGGNGLRISTARDAGVTGGVVATGGSILKSGSGGSGGASSTQGSTSQRALGANECHVSADCQREVTCVPPCPRYVTCVPPGGAPPCGLCRTVTPCVSDSECQTDGASLICGPAPLCSCPLGAKTCVLGCVDASGCGVGQVCAAGHCVPASCARDVDCPTTDFACTGGSCRHKDCTSDADCAGFCVNQTCYSQPGTCYGPVALRQPRMHSPLGGGAHLRGGRKRFLL